MWVNFVLPSSIISYRDNRFLGKFWKTLWEKMDTKLRISITFHPQTDGQIEVVNRIVIQLLRGYYDKYPKSWDEHIACIQHYYNRFIYTYTSTTHFETCFGYLPSS